ncbi:related to Cytochrome P450 4F8 [Sporisorium reilianum f. sp. reilianum]|uniref:Related to Cytochrome P450 4F8 n=1 Tax=Sporisorium reilianum f. sp. reilianum TaxID=72559 RepID=A0A2N8UBJ0_9BASI|nr:related to Cytochrome P450 4F8 [Sporisorium reilianum f. sp. reilianum]
MTQLAASSSAQLLTLIQTRPLASAFTALILYITYKLAIKPILFPSPYRHLPRPERASYILGQRLVEAKGLTYTDPASGAPIFVHGPGEVTKHYARVLNSSIFIFPEPFGGETLNISDPFALNAILADIDTFQSDLLRSSIIEFIVGNGIVTRYGDAHRRQRKLMAPAFTPAHLKGLTPIFAKYAELMCAKIASHGDDRVDFAEYLDCTMLDIIGEAGFGYRCLALERGREGSELSSAFNAVNQAAIDFGPARAIHLGLSALLYPRAATWPLSEANRRIQKVNRVMDRITMHIVRAAKQSVLGADDLHDKKDLLSLLIKSNLGAGVAERMTDREISGQIQTFMFAGYETSAVTTSWALYFLSRHAGVQAKLRGLVERVLRERKGVGLDEFQAALLEYDDVWCDELQYLDWILAETLRLCPPVPGNDREAIHDTVLPLMSPLTLANGTTLTQLPITKGTRVTINIKSVNYNPLLFGADAHRFRPERFADLPDAHARAKLPPHATYSFVAGPKSCIGQKFALTEMKVLIISILARFELAPEPGVTIRQHQALIVRPRVETTSGGPAAGMPLRIKRLPHKAPI